MSIFQTHWLLPTADVSILADLVFTYVAILAGVALATDVAGVLVTIDTATIVTL